MLPFVRIPGLWLAVRLSRFSGLHRGPTQWAQNHELFILQYLFLNRNLFNPHRKCPKTTPVPSQAVGRPRPVRWPARQSGGLPARAQPSLVPEYLPPHVSFLVGQTNIPSKHAPDFPGTLQLDCRLHVCPPPPPSAPSASQSV